MMEMVEEVVIVGAGIGGLATSLGLHRLGIRSLVLESSASLRATGFAFTTWANAWRALDALGIGDSLRQHHNQLLGMAATSSNTGLAMAEMSFKTEEANGGHEVRCMKRNMLLETLERELPHGTVRYSSKVVSVEDSGYFKLVHIADGSVIKTKVLIGCDGVNSAVAQWLGLKKPAFAGRSAIRGQTIYKGNHGFESKFYQFFGDGVRSGFIPSDDDVVYWFLTFSPSSKDKEVEENPAKMKDFVLSKLGKVPDKVKTTVEMTELNNIMCSSLRLRHPWELLWGNISKGNVCVLGDAFHPMTPDLGQGGCAALEDGVTLARCLAKALLEKPNVEPNENTEKEEYKRIEMGLKKYAKERRWRGLDLIATGYMVGLIQQGDGVVTSFLRDKMLAPFLANLLLKKAKFDCGKLSV
ncbi:hypothetical protein CsSME_00009138 [Camellia sinensis var. sinensis]|uniref:monooxygenase 2-like n=1 Tax=Camellia sinensis TaxID=4442 RepID=UPI00103593B0|nr:monooxygenase 2-like [Camellia sinensis]